MRPRNVLIFFVFTILNGCFSGEQSDDQAKSTIARFPIVSGCRDYTSDFFSKRLHDSDVRFYVEEFRVKFEASSSVEAIGVLEAPPRIDDIRLSRLISELSRGCYPDTYTEVNVRDDVDALNLGVDLKHVFHDRMNISSLVVKDSNIRVYHKNHKTVEEALAEGEMEAVPPTFSRDQ